MKHITTFALIFFVAVTFCGCRSEESPSNNGQSDNSNETAGGDQNENQPTLVEAELGTTPDLTRFGNFYLAGQFAEEDVAIMKDAGVEVVINLREDSEMTWDEQGVLEAAGIEYISIPFAQPETLTDEVFNRARAALAENSQRKVMLHCKSAGRVGCIWGAYRAMDDGLSIDEAIEEGKEVGMRSWLTDRLREYLEANQSE
ncbi:MAG: protein tyrosine phosphatase family protein [Planctomycetota bacterium]